MSTFTDRLLLDLRLTLGGTVHAIPSGNVKRLALELYPWGFEGCVEFFIADESQSSGEKDEMLADFVKDDLGEVSLAVQAAYPDRAVDGDVTPIAVSGLIRERSVEELVYVQVSGAPVLYRRYSVTFVDPAQLRWRQHYPVALYAEKMVKDVIDAQKGDEITVTYDWDDVLGTSHPMIFLGLEGGGGVSFYDFVAWFTDTQNGVFTHDYSTGGYRLTAQKSVDGAAIPMIRSETGRLVVRYPEVPRASGAVLNSYAPATTHTAIDFTPAVAGVVRNYLVRTSIADEAGSRVTRETARMKTPVPLIDLTWARFPAQPVAPNALVEFSDAGQWSTARIPMSTKGYRVRELRLGASAKSQGPDADHLAEHAPYDISLDAILEAQDDTIAPLPPYATPRWPAFVEGTVVSETGADTDLTWQSYQDQQTSVDQIHVKVPLWDNQIIPVPFEPHLMPGHFYFPVYRDQRVLLAMNFLDARIDRFLDWRPGARLPLDGQGDHLLLGKTEQNRTSLRHYYEDEKPVFSIERANNKDTGVLVIKEGKLTIEVREDQGS